MGGVVNYLATTKANYPQEKLSLIVSLASPLGESPQFSNDEIVKLN